MWSVSLKEIYILASKHWASKKQFIRMEGWFDFHFTRKEQNKALLRMNGGSESQSELRYGFNSSSGIIVCLC